MALKQAIAVAMLLAWASAVGAEVRNAAGIVRVVTQAPHDSVTVGQRFPVSYHVSAPDSLTAIARDRLDAGDCRAVSLSWRETQADGVVRRTADVVMIPVALDSVAVPPVSFDFVSPRGDTLRAWSDGFDVPIRRIALASEDVRPLKSQWEVPPDYLKWGAIALAALALAAAIVWWVRRRRRRVMAAAPEVRLPPDYIALAELERIAGLGLVERGELKSYYTLVADVVRHYLTARFGVESMDRTTHELMDELAQRRIEVDGLHALLSEADLVKFAKLKPEASFALRAIDEARAIVMATTPRAAPTAAEATGTES
jgi:hypothetical protein